MPAGRTTQMRVLHVASECYPLIKTGGLADVVGALPGALAQVGVSARVFLPNYPMVAKAVTSARAAMKVADLFGGPASVLKARGPDGLTLYLLDAPHLFDRPGNPYLGPDGKDWSDNPLRFAALAKMAARFAANPAGNWRPDIVHAHDWQAALVPAYLRAAKIPKRRQAMPRTVMTIHNMAFQGLMPAKDRAVLGLPAAMFTDSGMEYYGQVSFLKAGLVYADHLTTVSPTYARETRTEEFGMGLHGVLRERADAYTGILNGVDINVWDPETDPLIAAPYSRARRAGKARNKAALQTAFGLPQNKRAPLFAVVSRLTEQKGLDLLLDVLPMIADRGGQLAVLGSGDARLEAGFRAAAKARPDHVGVQIGYDEPLSHLIQAGSDILLVPSRFEPCGLTQLYALRYGTVPLVARTGGLADTVIDANDAALATGTATGIQFAPVTVEALAFALERAFDLVADARVWRKLTSRAMAHPVSWGKSAEVYGALYRDLAAAPTATQPDSSLPERK